MYAITKDGEDYRREWWSGTSWVNHSLRAKYFTGRFEAELEAREMIAMRPSGNWSVFCVAD